MVQSKTSAGRQDWRKRCGDATLFLCIVLGATAVLRAQGVRYDNIVLGPRGTPVGAATVAVCSAGASTSTTPCSPLANIYADEALTQPIANPFPADSLGNYGFWAAPGHYVVQIYGAGVATKTMDVFLPCDPSNCSMSSATFSTLTAGTINLTGALTVNGRNVSTEPKAGDAVMYVSPNGNDSADGFSWGSAKQTLYAAVTALITNAGGGTIYVAQNTSCGGPTGQLMLYRAVSNPGSGWIQLSGALDIVGVGNASWAPGSPGPQVSLSCGSASLPALELNGVNTSVRFRNLIFTGSQGATITDSSTVTFDNVGFVVNDSNATNGPAVFIGPASFEIYFRHCDFHANDNAGVTHNGADATEAFVVNPGSGGAPGNLIYVDQSIEEYGVLKFYGDGISWVNGLQVNGLLLEAGGDAHGAVWFPAGMTGYGNAVIANVQVADSAAGTPAVENDNSIGADELLVEGAATSAGSALNVTGPATVLSQYQPTLQNLTALPLVSGQPGPIYGHSFYQNDSGRWIFSPTAGQFTNLMPAITTATVNGWYSSGGGSITLSATPGPDGANTGVKAVNGNTYGAGVGNGPTLNLANGDYLIWGVWEKGAPNNNVGLWVGGGQCSGITLTSLLPSVAEMPVEGWQWVSGADKISGSNSSCATYLEVLAPASSTAYASMPVLYHVAAGTISDAHAALLALDMAPYPGGLAPPVEATLPGHPFAFGGSGDSYFATLDHTALTANQTYDFPNASGTVCVAGAGTAGCGSGVADTTTTVGTTAVAANSCTAATTVTMSGVTTSMAFSFTPTTDISAVTGWGSTGGLVIDAWPTANALNYKVCNQTASSITPSASVTFNVSAR